MARIFITGSADGLGQFAAKRLAGEGHRVVLHARNAQRAEYAISRVPGAEKVLIADLSSLSETKELAEETNQLGAFDTVIHNAGVYQASGQVILTVNTLAPYILTALIHKPGRIIYLASRMHFHGSPDLGNLDTGRVRYADSKLHNLILAKAVARRWPEVYSNAVDPGWVPTKMGGAGAPDDLQKGFETQVWLAAGRNVTASGRYFFHLKEARYLNEADNTRLQDEFLERCERITGVRFPG